jgi:hypothetical protein
MNKYCPSCQSDKPLSEFYWVKTRSRASSYCKACTRKQQSDWAKSNRERRLQINREWCSRNRKRKQTMMAASNAVQAAIKHGLLVRPDRCECCSVAGKIEAAHHDYSQPLNVRWLCQSCHRTWDSLNPKTAKTTLTRFRLTKGLAGASLAPCRSFQAAVVFRKLPVLRFNSSGFCL